jgi:hypothetical protein
MRAVHFLALLAGVSLFLVSCAGPDGKVTTSTPTGPGVTSSGNTATNVETVPSGLNPDDRVTTPLNKEGPAARATAQSEGEAQPGK